MFDRIGALRLGAACVFAFISAQVAPGCDATGSADGSGGGEAGSADGGGGAGQAEQSSCKDACNQLKFFDCANANDHASCFGACETASESAIEVFVACVQNDICDPECSTDLVGSTNPGGEGGGEGGGGSPAGCTAACEGFVAEGCVPAADCAALCASLSPVDQGLVTYCIERRDGCTLPDECLGELPGTPPDPAADCEAACDSLKFFDCIDAQTHADCRSQCQDAAAADSDSFVACVEAGICDDASCYDAFGGDGGAVGGEVGGGEVGGGNTLFACQAACDQMEFFDCVDAGQATTCRDTCTSASATSIDAMIDCAFECSDDSCFQAFVSAQ